MVANGIAEKLPEPVWRNESNEIVDAEAKAFGLKTPYNLIRPDKLLFVDEVGSNTSQKKDGHKGGEELLVRKGRKAQQKAATKDAHFTVMGFTAANGEPIMCCIIFAKAVMDPAWQLGLDPFALWEGNEVDVEGNTGGEGKRYPKGPECNPNGKKVPCFCCCSESGGINGDLLTSMLRHMDKIGVFDRSDGVNPFLILDGHGSRLNWTSLNTLMMDATYGKCALEPRTEPPFGKWGTALNKMGASRWT
jgi:hypothetical protein